MSDRVWTQDEINDLVSSAYTVGYTDGYRAHMILTVEREEFLR